MTDIGTRPLALIIAGPTASGKSALALDTADRLNGTIINTDSMQVYRELRVLTARPTLDEEARVPHRLYGVRPAAQAGSVAWWREAALDAMTQERAAGRLPILTGGTGMYFLSLTRGLSDMPPVDAASRAEARALLAEQGPEALYVRLAEIDPAAAARLNPADSQRLARAWEVWRATGIPLSDWQQRQGTPAPWRFAAILLDPPRDALRAAIAHRFDAMLAGGALDEVRSLLAQQLDPALPAMRAHGVPEISAHLAGTLTLDEARRRVELVTGQYTKRQATWFRHHNLAVSAPSHTIHARYAGLTQLSESERADLLSFIHRLG